MMQTKSRYSNDDCDCYLAELTLINLDHFILYIWEENDDTILKAIRQGTRQACEVYRAVFMSDHNAREV